MKEEQDDLTFEVASALWEQLGEQLVGKAPIALAELIKNGYDADASLVTVYVDPGEDSITVTDDGHGMTRDEFKKYWATVGTSHKREAKSSRDLSRPLTGSKGVGRISTRLLANQIIIETVSKRYPHIQLIAKVDWKQATNFSHLTKTPISLRVLTHKERQPPGTKIILQGLKTKWEEEDIMETAGEVWKLQPPFQVNAEAPGNVPFRIAFASPDGDLTEAFQERVQRILSAHDARISGTIEDGMVHICIEFQDEAPLNQTWKLSELKHSPLRSGKPELRHADFEIRVYRKAGRQRAGLKLAEVKEYLEAYRGVQIFDTGFRLPYYGNSESDWLLLNEEHARRTSVSQLLPDEFQFERGQQKVPTVHHLLGQVNVNTSNEPDLFISAGRDRLTDSQAFRELRTGVRLAIDWYAHERVRREVRELEQSIQRDKPTKTLSNVLASLDNVREYVPPEMLHRLERGVESALSGYKETEKKTANRIALLGSLATAGVSAVAFQHEMSKQALAVEGLIQRLEETLSASKRASSEEVRRLKQDFEDWLERTRNLGGLFSHFTELSNLTDLKRYSVLKTVNHVLRGVEKLMPGVKFSQEGSSDIKFPDGTLGDWVSILQNVVFNAANAMDHADEKRLRFEVNRNRKQIRLRVLDTGSGIDMDTAEDMFQPFSRQGDLAPERRAAGFGGMGLGLTIVRMVASERGVQVGFVEPPQEFATAFEMSWREA